MPRKNAAASSSGKQKAKSPEPTPQEPEPAPQDAALEESGTEMVSTKSFSSTIETRSGVYSKSIEEYKVLPKFKIPRLSWDDVNLDILDIESNTSFDSDLETHVESFGPHYTSLERRDKQYVIANIKGMLVSIVIKTDFKC